MKVMITKTTYKCAHVYTVKPNKPVISHHIKSEHECPNCRLQREIEEMELSK